MHMRERKTPAAGGPTELFGSFVPGPANAPSPRCEHHDRQRQRRFTAPKMMRNSSVNDGPRGAMEEVIDIEGDSHTTLGVFECERLPQRLARGMPALAA